ncbi:MAG: thioredoxin [Chloroflexi bacterium]|nr:thioredoxin [Chloroflexota bacterium]
MPVFDTPIHTDDNNLNKVLAQPLPVVLYLYDSRQKADTPLEDAINTIAKKNAGSLLVARIDVANNPRTRAEYGSLPAPAVVTLAHTPSGKQVKSQAGSIRPGDARAHVNYLLDKGPLPASKPAAAPQAAPAGGDTKPQTATDANFRSLVLNSKVPVLVDFWAPWCGPCRMIAPEIDRLAQEYAGRVKVVKLNVDENQATSYQYQVQSIPTFILFRDGKVAQRQVGANPRVLRDMVEAAAVPAR